MYRSCIFCSAPLGSNDSIERFPVGRSLAFGAAKGRLWAICPRCARWNLAPIEERWEAIEDAERLFRDTRLRVQRESIGLAKLRDGTRLVRVGEALEGELAAWRYGERIMMRGRSGWAALARRSEKPLYNFGYWLLVGGLLLGAAPATMVGGTAAAAGASLAGLRYMHRAKRVVHVLGDPADARAVAVRGEDVEGVRITAPDDGRGMHLFVPYSQKLQLSSGEESWGRFSLVLRGEPAKSALARLMVHVNAQGAPAHTIAQGLEMVIKAGSPEAYLETVASSRPVLAVKGGYDWDLAGGVPLTPHTALALEMALHEETERRALHGELAMLEAMWRQAEEIAAIADRLPDVDPEPPRLSAEH
jgi:hypothetical protein